MLLVDLTGLDGMRGHLWNVVGVYRRAMPLLLVVEDDRELLYKRRN